MGRVHMIDKNKKFRESMKKENYNIDSYPFAADEMLLESELRRLREKEEADAVGDKIAQSRSRTWCRFYSSCKRCN